MGIDQLLNPPSATDPRVNITSKLTAQQAFRCLFLGVEGVDVIGLDGKPIQTAESLQRVVVNTTRQLTQLEEAACDECPGCLSFVLNDARTESQRRKEIALAGQGVVKTFDARTLRQVQFSEPEI